MVLKTPGFGIKNFGIKILMSRDKNSRSLSIPGPGMKIPISVKPVFFGIKSRYLKNKTSKIKKNPYLKNSISFINIPDLKIFHPDKKSQNWATPISRNFHYENSQIFCDFWLRFLGNPWFQIILILGSFYLAANEKSKLSKLTCYWAKKLC